MENNNFQSQRMLNQSQNNQPRLQLGKQISFNAYAKQLSPLNVYATSEEQQLFSKYFLFPQQTSCIQKKCLSIEETISKVKEYSQQNHNLFEQFIQNKGDEIYQLTKMPKTIKKEIKLEEPQQEQINAIPAKQYPEIQQNQQINQIPSKTIQQQDEKQIQRNEELQKQEHIKTIPTDNQNVLQVMDSHIKLLETPLTITCNCKKSHCLKLYCECFNKNQICGANCKCKECKNKPEFAEKRQKAIEYILSRSIKQSVTTPIPLEQQQIIMEPENLFKMLKIGCICKKSHCQKKYCECFHNGSKCTELCKCQQCKNGGLNCFQQDDKKNKQLEEQGVSQLGIGYNLRKPKAIDNLIERSILKEHQLPNIKQEI